MRKNKPRRQQFTMSFLGVILGISLILLFLYGGTMQIYAQTEKEEASLEKSAAWESAADYQAVINLKVSGIEKYIQKEVPISVIPLLDVTASMERCETPGHYHKIFSHWVSAFEGAAQLWKNSIMPVLPTPEEYAQMGQENADAMLLKFPEEIDPYGRCRLVYQKGRSEQKDYYSLFNWRVFYVTDDGTPLYPLRESHEMNYDFAHTVFADGVYLPVGTAEEVGGYTAWAYTSYKEPGHTCEYSRIDQLKEGYSQFIQALFENLGVRVCPVAFGGGYSINGWTDDAQEAIDFIVQEKYLEKEQVMPDYNCGTNYEAALAGAMDAVNRLEKNENTFAILFTDGVASSGYDHASGKADLGRLDTHSYDMPDHDKSWYPVFADWAIQDAQSLKESIPIYSVGYGSALDQESAMETLQKISSGGEYFIDTRSTSIQTVTDIFRAIYSDIIYKATKVHIVDYISEFWEIQEEKLLETCKIDRISIVNQKGQPDTISKLTYPITREMGADGQEELQVPVILREEYRDVADKTWYETNQDAPLNKDQEGAGAYMEYIDLEGVEQRIDAETPRLEVYPKQPDFLLEKTALDLEVKAGGKARYEFCLVNCGQANLSDIWLEDVFSEKGITLLFDQADGIVQEKEGSLCIKSLKEGEKKIITGTAEIPEDFQGNLENTVTATTENPQEPNKKIKKEAKASIQVIPLKMDFQVEKTVDKEQSSPGETLTYQIRISNTGEMKLNSMIVTDKFEKADVQAVFQKQEGVTVQKDGTQAIIENILPGEDVVLIAIAEIPLDFPVEKLLNTVLVYPNGKKDKEKSAQVSVSVQKESQEEVSGNTISDNQEQQISGNTISGNDEQQISGNTISGNEEQQISGNTISGNDEQQISGNTISGNEEQQISENFLSSNEEQQIMQKKYASATTVPGTLSNQKGSYVAAATPRAAYNSTTSASTDSPKTGDDAPLFLLTVLMGIAGFTIGVIGYYRFRRRRTITR